MYQKLGSYEKCPITEQRNAGYVQVSLFTNGYPLNIQSNYKIKFRDQLKSTPFYKFRFLHLKTLIVSVEAKECL